MTTTESYEYRDDDLTMNVPSYLRPRKGIRYFAPRGGRTKELCIFGLAVDIIRTEEHAEGVRQALRGATDGEWMDVERRIVRRGTISWLEGGTELLSTSFHTSDGESVHDYHVFFPSGRNFVHVTVAGRGSVALFDSACRDIVSSIRLRAPVEGREAEGARRGRATAERPPTAPAERGQPGLAHASLYLIAKARVRREGVHSALILPEKQAGGVRLFLLSKLGDVLIPGPSSWHETEEAAKAEALQSLKIRESDWVAHDGEPEWAQAMREAQNAAIKASTDARAARPRSK